MKFGIKLWSNNLELIKKAGRHYDNGDFDCIELSAIMDSFDEKALDSLKGIPVIIHCDNKNVNFADEDCSATNLQALIEAKKFADYLNAEFIIVHPGHNGSYESINKVLLEANDTRICVENMPGRTYDLKYECLGRTKDELSKIIAKKHCLDSAHAVKAAKTLGLQTYKLIKELACLNPVIVHISDGFIASEVDEHLDIGKGNFDFNKFKQYIKADYITLETPKITYNTLEADVENVNRLKKILKG